MRGRESRWEKAAPWRERGRSEREHGVERVDYTVKEDRFKGGKGGQPRRASLGYVIENMSGRVDAKALQLCRVLVSLLVWPDLKWERRLGDEEPAHKMKE